MSEARKIYKYEIDVRKVRPDGSVSVQLPGTASVLSVAAQNDRLFLWAMVSPRVESKPRWFYVIGTGHDLPAKADITRSDCAFVGTVMMYAGSLVLHVFEDTDPAH